MLKELLKVEKIYLKMLNVVSCREVPCYDTLEKSDQFNASYLKHFIDIAFMLEHFCGILI